MNDSLFIRLAGKLPSPETADLIVLILCALAVILLWIGL